MAALAEIYPGYGLKGTQVTQQGRTSKRWNCLVYRQSIDARLVR